MLKIEEEQRTNNISLFSIRKEAGYMEPLEEHLRMPVKPAQK